MKIEIDKKSGIPLYLQIKRQIKKIIKLNTNSWFSGIYVFRD